MTTSKPGRASEQFALRLPDGMRDLIKESAQRNGRSMNAEIVVALEMYFGVTGGKPLFNHDDPSTFDLSGLPEEEKLRRIVESSAQKMYEELKIAISAPPPDISNPTDLPASSDDDEQGD